MAGMKEGKQGDLEPTTVMGAYALSASAGAWKTVVVATVIGTPHSPRGSATRYVLDLSFEVALLDAGLPDGAVDHAIVTWDPECYAVY
jgi:hypothetical protein